MSVYTNMKNSVLVMGVSLVALTLSACGSGRAGESSSSKEGFALAEPIIMAVEQYYIENNYYPQKLDILVPDHITSIPMDELGELQMRYRPWLKQSSYKFTFVPDDGQRCDYEPESRWICTGH